MISLDVNNKQLLLNTLQVTDDPSRLVHVHLLLKNFCLSGAERKFGQKNCNPK